jgi:hypothetical protein
MPFWSGAQSDATIASEIYWSLVQIPKIANFLFFERTTDRKWLTNNSIQTIELENVAND